MSVWMHKRKGRVVGVEVVPTTPNDTWMFVTLHDELRGALSEWEPGETVALRRSFMTLVQEPEGRES